MLWTQHHPQSPLPPVHTARTTMSPVPTTWPMSVSWKNCPISFHLIPYSTSISCHLFPYKVPHLSSHLKLCPIISHSPNPLLTFFLCPLAPISLSCLLPLLCFGHVFTARKGERKGEKEGGVVLDSGQGNEQIPCPLLCSVWGQYWGWCLEPVWRRTRPFYSYYMFFVCSHLKSV